MSNIPVRRTDLTKSSFIILKVTPHLYNSKYGEDPQLFSKIRQITDTKRWGPWQKAKLISNYGSESLVFKQLETDVERALFLKEYTKDALYFIAERPWNNTPKERIKTYAPWALNAIINERLLPAEERGYILPLNLKAFINDLCYIENEKRNGLNPAHAKSCGLLTVKTLKDFAEAVRSYQKLTEHKKETKIAGLERIPLTKPRPVFPQCRL